MDINALNELVEGILAIFNNQVIRIVLYGSYARGNNTSESDVDVDLLLNKLNRQKISYQIWL